MATFYPLAPPLRENRFVPTAASERGWAELRAGRWEPARQAFEGDESAAALEGLSWAAWWLDDAEAVFAAREDAYRRYRRDGDPASAARMATWLAADALDFHGADAVASGWLRRARRLLDDLEVGPDHGWLAFHEGYVAYGKGDRDAARRLAVDTAELGRRFEVPDLEMLGLALEGSVLVASGLITEGMRRLDEAAVVALADEATIPISSAWTCCLLVGACTAVLDFDRASEWCARIEEFARRYGSRYMFGFCRAEYGAIHLWCGRWDAAETMYEESIEAYAQSRPPWTSGPLAGLAELRRRQGRTDEARALLERAGGTRNAQLCRTRLLLDAGDAAAAVDLLERLRRGAAGPSQAPVLELLVVAHLARNEIGEAAAAAAELGRLAEHVGTPPLRAAADLAEGRVAAARGEQERARLLLESAVDRYDRSAAPYEGARARLALGETLLALGRTGQAAAETAQATAKLRQLTGGPKNGVVTRREREVLALLADGLTNRQIAQRLVVSEHTVHRHVTNILRKLALPSRTAAAAEAVRSGLLDT
jgi:DNA-binding CsgD family transcriptional regulator